MGRYKLVVFDWDGTVADSLHGIVTAMQAAIGATNLPVRDTEAIKGIIGLGLDESAAALYPEIEAPLRDELVLNYRQHYLATAIGSTVLFPRVESTLEKLLDQGYQLAVATGKSRRGLDRAIQETRVGKYFQVSRCADETFSKPHPQMLYEIMEISGMAPEETIMVGDSEHDLQMAVNAGVSSIAVSYGAQAIERLLEFNPQTGIHCLSELPEWLINTQ